MKITLEALARKLLILSQEYDAYFLPSIKGNRLYVATECNHAWPEDLGLEYDHDEMCWYVEVGP